MSWDLVSGLLLWAGVIAAMVNVWAHLTHCKTLSRWTALTTAVVYALGALARIAGGHSGTWSLGISVMWFGLWWWSGGGDDWRKLKRRAASAVRVAGARLSVVPVPAGGAA